MTEDRMANSEHAVGTYRGELCADDAKPTKVVNALEQEKAHLSKSPKRSSTPGSSHDRKPKS